MSNRDYDQFLEILKGEVNFPSYYPFKFIVKVEYRDQLVAIFGEHRVEFTPSKKGNYISVTCQMLVATPEQVIEIYKKASAIQGVIAL